MAPLKLGSPLNLRCISTASPLHFHYISAIFAAFRRSSSAVSILSFAQSASTGAKISCTRLSSTSPPPPLRAAAAAAVALAARSSICCSRTLRAAEAERA